MNEIIPSINCENFPCIQERLAKAGDFCRYAHIDVSDGKFTPHVSWGDPDEFAAQYKESPMPFEVHLMVEDPEMQTDRWLRAGASRIIVHLEAMNDPVYILEKCKQFGAECILAINPATPVERLFAHLDDFNGFLLLAVFPGPSGQQFKMEIMQKIKALRERVPRGIIEVDGGMNEETVKLTKEAGANRFVAGHTIWISDDPKRAFQTLQEI